MVDIEDLLQGLRKRRVPYRLRNNGRLSYPCQAWKYNKNLAWVKRKCPALYYKLTRESRERPLGYGAFRPHMRIKKRYILVGEQDPWVVFYGLRADGTTWVRLFEKPAGEGDSWWPTDEERALFNGYINAYAEGIMKVRTIKVPIRRLDARPRTNVVQMGG